MRDVTYTGGLRDRLATSRGRAAHRARGGGARRVPRRHGVRGERAGRRGLRAVCDGGDGGWRLRVRRERTAGTRGAGGVRRPAQRQRRHQLARSGDGGVRDVHSGARGAAGGGAYVPSVYLYAPRFFCVSGSWAVITPLLLLLRLSPFYTGGRRLERDLSAATACRRLCRNRMGRIETVFSQRSLPNELPSTVNVQFSEAEALCECGGVISDQGAIRWSQRTTWTFSWRA